MLTLLVALAASQVLIKDEGTTQGWAKTLNCSGSGVTCTVDAPSRTATIEVTTGEGGGLPGTIPAVTYTTSSDLSAERVLSAGNYTTVDLGTAAQAQVDWAHGLTCSAGQALTSSGTTAMACTSTLTASDLACAGTCVADAEIAAVAGAKVSGTVANATLAATATALAADPSACAAGSYVTDITAAGVLTCSAPAGTAVRPKVITSNVTNSTTTPTSITGLSWAVAANTEYGFHCVVTASGTATGGPRYNLNGPAGATTVSFLTQRFTTTALQTLLVLQAFSAAAQTAACTSGCNTTVLVTKIQGAIINGANAGTAQLMLTSSTAGQLTTVFRGSFCVVY